MLSTQLAALKSENLGGTNKSKMFNKPSIDGVSQKTGMMSQATKISDGAHDKTDDFSVRSTNHNEKIMIEKDYYIL